MIIYYYIFENILFINTGYNYSHLFAPISALPCLGSGCGYNYCSI